MVVHVVGNVGLDLTFALARLPRAGETLNAASGARGLGGKGANQAVAASRTGAPTAFHAAIGSDPEGALIRARLADEGLDLVGLVAMEGPSDVSAILVDAAGENAIASLVARARGFDPLAAGILPARLAAGDVLLMQGNLPLETTLRCLAHARGAGATTVLNASPLEDRDAWRFDAVDWLVVNAIEASALSGAEDREESVRRLLRRGARAVLLSLGAGGALLATGGGETLRVPASAVAARDTSGAGDVLCGLFTGLLALGRSPQAALRIAVAGAGIAVTRVGTLASCPSATEIATLLSSTTEPHP
ncbi:PfkB family carbohydrate kinase [Aurantimonas sp. Leaf443]|uniref:PfkB family carbohydrate kinase n=1 Tax=Aurantimonas sp. Leaf443 TaxID=1736378 RepID=UPI0006F26D8E|nr:PfkB family carbohydrate kinase [Aurantimonas sp. Leaf443]KQT85421.1 hypothetical protein ASG48_09305 [Aurantimonas sp. Leaf443]